MEDKAFIVQSQFKNSGDLAEISGRALNDISLGRRLSIVKENVTSVYIVMEMEAYRKSIEILFGMYGGIILLRLYDGPGCDFNENDILRFG